MFQLEQLTLMHRADGEWHQLSPAEPTPDDYDLERRVLRGGRLFRCSRCEIEVMVSPGEDS
ncbi:MAG TPA: hypothetical protein VHK28_03360 [Candidatus Limnocylindria bacterium]|nr:hypothetical protein [Candidatus Limnocylindria bacterium]